MDSLVENLATRQPVEFESRTRTLEELKERLLDMKFAFVAFPETKGGTEIGINIDIDLSDVKDADFNNGSGHISLIGTCELNYQKVRCIAEIDLSTKKGMGFLECVQ